MNVYRANSVAADRGKTPEGFFHGHARLTTLASVDQLPIRINRVEFDAGARTIWHSHEGGQLLVVVEGAGQVATRDGVEPIGVGDAVWTDAGEEHWHGAGDGSSLVHIAVSAGETIWMRP